MVNVPVITREFVLKCWQVKERVMFERPGCVISIKAFFKHNFQGNITFSCIMIRVRT